MSPKLIFEYPQKEAVLKSWDTNEKKISDDLNSIRNWLKKHPYLPRNLNISEKKIILFLLISKGSVETAKRKIENFYVLRSMVSNQFETIKIEPKLEEAMDIGVQMALPKPFKNLYPIFLIKFQDIKTDNFNPLYAFQVGSLLSEIYAEETIFRSTIFIYDMEGLTPAHLVKVDMLMMKKLKALYEDILTVKFEAVHILNMPSFFETLLKIIKSILKPKLSERIHIHKDLESLYKEIPKELLPKELGGASYKLDEVKEYWKNKLIEYEDYFNHLNSLRIVKRRPSKEYVLSLISSDSIDGNFRKLEID